MFYNFSLSTSCFLLDAYVEEVGSRCLRKEQSDRTVSGDRELTRPNAMDECSKNKRCVGIEQQIVGYKLCLDSIYKSTAWDKYEKSTKFSLKKSNNYGKYTANEAT